MGYLKLSFSSFSKNKLTFVFMIIVIAVLFLTVNFMISTLADRQMLTKGYEKVLSDNTAVVCDINYTVKMAQGLVGSYKESREQILSDITDEYELYFSAKEFAKRLDGEEVVVIAVSDEIYNNLALPLVSGDYSEAVASFGFPDESVTVNKNGCISEIKISGNLTKDTYLPISNSFSTSNDFTASDLYSDPGENNSFIIARTSSFNTDMDFSCDMSFLIHFPENYDENIAKLREKAGVQEGKAILENSQKALWEDLADFIPVVVCILLVVIIGTMSISIILNKYNEKRGGVLWICGFSRRQILFAHFMNMLIIFVVAAILSIGAYLIMSLLQVELVVSANLSAANIIATIALSLILILASMIIPAIRSKNTSPVEYLRRAK